METTREGEAAKRLGDPSLHSRADETLGENGGGR